MATLFGIVTIAMVASFSLAPDEEPESIDAGADDAEAEDSQSASAFAVAAIRATPSSSSTTTEPAPETRPIQYETALDELAVHDATSYDEAVLSSEPDEAPAAPTTAPPTTAAPTTAETATTVAGAEPDGEPTPDGETTTTLADGETTTTGDGTDTTQPTDTTDTTQPPDTTEAPPTTTHPDGFVDAGHGVFVPEILLAIRFCESRDNYTAANPSSSARGAYQFLTGSWEGYGHAARYGVGQAHLATPAQQDEAALITWQRDGTRPWNASRHCWG